MRMAPVVLRSFAADASLKQLRLVVCWVLWLAWVVLGASPVQAQLLKWNTFGNNGTETTEPPTFRNLNLDGATGTLTLNSVTPNSNTNRFGGIDWSTTSQPGSDYIEFKVKPQTGFRFSATSFVFSWDRDKNGPKSVALKSSNDNFDAYLGTPVTRLAAYDGVEGGELAVSTGNTFTFSLLNITAETTFRVYGYNAKKSTGKGGFDTTATSAAAPPNVQLNGYTSSASARTLVWDGGGLPNSNWNTAANWVSDDTPVNGDSLEFAGSTQLTNKNDISGLSLVSITFNSGAGTFVLNENVVNGNAVALSGGGITNNSANLQTVNLPITLSGTQNFNATSGNLAFSQAITNGGNTLLVTGGFNTAISGAVGGAGGLTKTDGGILTLTNVSNGYSGETTISNGTLKLSPTSGTNNIAFSPKITVGEDAFLNVTDVGGVNANGFVLSASSGQTLAGIGTVVGRVAVASGTTISPADTGLIDTLTTGSEIWQAGGKYHVDIDTSADPAPNTVTNDLILLSGGDLSITSSSGTRFVIEVAQTGTLPNQWITIASSTTATLTGFDPSKFTLPGGFSIRAEKADLSGPYTGGGGFAIQLSPAPEPTTTLFFSSSVGALTLGRWRRRRTTFKSVLGLLAGRARNALSPR
jgi:autotransporter-associated beta strand protein